MSMKYKYISAPVMMIFGGMFAGMFTGMTAFAQNLNPTVSVSRTYEGELAEVHKPDQTMAVPDSVRHFDLKFDYSVFDNPYKGAYDFTPYSLDLTPQPEAYLGNRLYLKVGAGYRLRPYLDFVWEPTMKGRLKLNVYASHHSYVGQYRTIRFDENLKLSDSGHNWSGYDLYSKAGVNGQIDLDKAALMFDVSYKGIHNKVQDTRAGFDRSGYNAGKVSLRAKSEEYADDYLYYDVKFAYGFSAQGFGGIGILPDNVEYNGKSLSMNDLDFDVTIGPAFRKYHKVVADFGLGATWYEGLFTSYTGVAYITPKYVFAKNRWNVAAGVKLSSKFSSGETVFGEKLNTNKGVLVYPDVRVGFMAVPKSLNIYLSAKGGDYRNSYASLKERNHFFTPFRTLPVTDNSAEQYNVALGFEGNIRTRFKYDLKAGHRSYERMPFDYCDKDGTAGLKYYDGTAFFANLAMKWDSKSFNLDSWFDVNVSDVENKGGSYFKPSTFTGFVSGTYNWKKRVFAGVSCEFASRRNGVSNDSATSLAAFDSSIPAWVDLGVNAEYALNRKLSFWIKADNLLNMTVQRNPLYAEDGIGFTAGVCVSL